MAIGAGTDGDGAGTGGFQADLAIALDQPEEAEAGAIALLRVRPVGEDGLDEGRGLGADGARPGREPGRRPLQVALMSFRHVGGVGGVATPAVTAHMGGAALAVMEDLDGARGEASVDMLVDERIRDGVVVPVQLDVVVDVDPRVDLPLAVDERLGRPRPERGLVEAREELPAAGAVQAHGAGVHVGEQLGDAGVEGGEGEEGHVAEAGEDPALHDLHADFRLGLVPGLRRPRGQDHGAVVLGELLVGALHAGLVATREGDTALELVRHDGPRHPAEELEGALMAGNPVGDLLGAGRFGVGVVRGAEDGDEELDRDHLAGGGVDDRGVLAGVIDEALLAGVMDLPHRQPAALHPPAVDLAELGVAVAVGVPLQVLQVEQLEGDAGLAPFGMQDGAVGPGPDPLAGDLGPPVEPARQAVLAQGLDLGPVQPGGAGPAFHAGHGPQPDLQALRHLPVAAAQGPLLSQDLAGVPHG